LYLICTSILLSFRHQVFCDAIKVMLPEEAYGHTRFGATMPPGDGAGHPFLLTVAGHATTAWPSQDAAAATDTPIDFR
jgi:hypothetical protein